MFMQLRRGDPFYSSLQQQQQQQHPLFQYNRLRREMDDLLSPAMYVLQHLNQPRVVVPNQQGNKDTFEVKLDVQNFAPEELNVKMVDNYVVIEAKHEEKEDEDGFIFRHFLRRYAIPDDVKPESINCSLSSDGILIISAPRMIEPPKQNEKNIQINFTGQPAVKKSSGGGGDNDASEQKENEASKTT